MTWSKEGLLQGCGEDSFSWILRTGWLRWGLPIPSSGLTLGQFSLREEHKGNSVPSLSTQELSKRKCAQAQGYEGFKDCIMRVIC